MLADSIDELLHAFRFNFVRKILVKRKEIQDTLLKVNPSVYFSCSSPFQPIMMPLRLDYSHRH